MRPKIRRISSGAKVSEAVIENWWRQGHDGRGLKKITVPVLVMHGDDDQIVPYADSAPLSAKLLRNSTLRTYKGFPHGMPTTEAGTINADLLAFITERSGSPVRERATV